MTELELKLLHYKIATGICLVLILALISIKTMGQDTQQWLSYFSDYDQEYIQQINSSINDSENALFGIVGTYSNDSVLDYLSYTVLSSDFFNAYNSKIAHSNNLINVYNKYIDATKGFIDSLNEYKMNTEYTLEVIASNRNALQNIDNSAIYDSLELAKNLISQNAIQENIILYQKQFFTFFSIANKAYLISDNSILPELPIQEEVKNHSEVQQSESENTYEFANVIVNNEVVESIKLSVQNYQPNSNMGFSSITSFDIDELTNYWESYLADYQTIEETTTTENVEALANNLQNTPVVENTENQSVQIDEEKKETRSTENVQPEYTKASAHKSHHSEIIPDANIPNSDKLLFRVQIAAGRTPISSKELNKKYSGSLEIKEFQEENWFKYYIAETETLKEAITIKKQSGISDAFIMAYKNGQKVQYYLRYVKADKESTRPGNFVDLSSLSFEKRVIVVQISASRDPISYTDICKKYKGDQPLNYLFEDGWHKYSFGNFDRFRAANNARKKSGIPDAFVVAYEKGVKIDLWAKYKTQ